MTLSQMERRRRRDPAEDIAGLTLTLNPPVTEQVRSNLPSIGSSTCSKTTTEIFTPIVGDPDDLAASANTSFQGEDDDSQSQDLFPAQLLEEIEADEGFRTSYKDSCKRTRADELVNILIEKTPFKDRAIPHGLDFRNRYELQRVADALNIAPSDLLSELRPKGVSSTADYDSFWNSIPSIAKKHGCARLPEKSDPYAWECASNTFFDRETLRKSVQLRGSLTFNSKPNEGLFNFELKSLTLDTGCRFHRKYGPSRFMAVSLPPPDKAPSKFAEDVKSGALKDGLARWLASDHEFLGRKWAAFYVEKLEKKSKSKMNSEGLGHRVHFFAVSGEEIPVEEAIGIESFLNWHIPIRPNLASTNLKAFQRFHLGLSKTYPTFPLNPFEFIRLRDPDDHAVMNDGCARMSTTLAKDIARHLSLGEVPSVSKEGLLEPRGRGWLCQMMNFVTSAKESTASKSPTASSRLIHTQKITSTPTIRSAHSRFSGTRNRQGQPR